ncbi:DJ-1/PfpI family protein [Saccharophagus degradans]|uniref:DJ-1 family glyoxalase III n=1 Tax=Saccharophagus degradans TaxID=86304 RepID=UPI002477F332|nr:DJ-1 family glyoxalase III [Saccharophagus degradans]WGO97307.1 DJ-1/PfpI family protein [Saccharophagus degradans]
MKQVLVLVADGTEEIEAVTVVDVLRRVGAKVTVASVMPQLATIEASRGVKIVADTILRPHLFDTQWDALVLPGGMPGAEYLGLSAEVVTLIKNTKAAGNIVAAICAAPAVVLGRNGLLKGAEATCHPSFQAELAHHTTVSSARVVDAGWLITSQGPGTAIEFALKLVARLYSPIEAAALAEAMVVDIPI